VQARSVFPRPTQPPTGLGGLATNATGTEALRSCRISEQAVSETASQSRATIVEEEQTMATMRNDLARCQSDRLAAEVCTDRGISCWRRTIRARHTPG
jgi:hypothetical protein